MHKIWKYTTNISLKMPYVGILVKHTLYSLYRSQKKFCKPVQREDNSYNLSMGRVSLYMSWCYGSLHLKTVVNKIVKIPSE